VYKVWETENYRFVPTKERLDHILENLSVQLPEDSQQNVIAYFEEIALSDHPRLIKDVKKTLERLSPKYKMGIISDSGFTPARILRKIIIKNGIFEFFDVILFSDETGYNKPHRIMFENVLSALSVKPSEAIHIGDLLHTDIEGAKAFGMKAAWIDYKGENSYGAHKPDFNIQNIREIVDVLDKLG
jgi:putative hydrolase of the HAD superfamily